MSIELYSHNQETYAKALDLFETERRVCIVQPTGTGKTFLFLKWIEDHQDDDILVMAPSSEIFSQLTKYAEETKDENILRNVQMITYQSILAMPEDERMFIRADKLILDEFHRLGAELWGPAVINVMENNAEAQILGASATPVRYLDAARDMAEEIFHNVCARTMYLGEAVQKSILPTPTYVAAWYDYGGKIEKYRERISREKNDDKRRNIEERYTAIQRNLQNAYGADKIFQKFMPHNHGKFIVFCRDAEHITEMIPILKEWLIGISQNIHVYISTSNTDRDNLQLMGFRTDNDENAIKLLFTVDRFNEGVHIKDIDGVIMLRPTQSPTIYLQQMGRALATKGSNPIIFDLVNNFDNVRVYDEVRDAIENIFEKEYKDSAGTTGENFKIFEQVKEYMTLVYDLESLLRDLNWDEIFALLQEFLAEFGREPKSRETYKGVNIGQWLEIQRRREKFGRLPEPQKAKLLEFGIRLETKDIDATWEQNCTLLQEFLAEFGKEPKSRETYKGVNIGRWLELQRKRERQGKLSEPRRAKLMESGIRLETKDIDATWEQNYTLLQEFLAEFGRKPKAKETYKGVNIGRWLEIQRQREKIGRLTEPQKAKLLESGIRLETKDKDTMWEQSCTLLQEFLTKFGRMPKGKETYKSVKLGIWVSTQRRREKLGRLPESQKAKLLEFGFEFEPEVFDTTWDQNYTVLQEFLAKFGRAPKDNETYKSVKLGAWLHNQRQFERLGKLPKPRRAKLLESGIRLETKDKDTTWEQNCTLLQEFLTEFGRAPRQKEAYKDVKLGSWLSDQRKWERKGKLPEPRSAKLRELGVLSE